MPTPTAKATHPANSTGHRQRPSTQKKPSPPSPTSSQSNTRENKDDTTPAPSSIPSYLPKRTTVLVFRLLRLLITFTIVHVLFTGQLPGSSRLWDSTTPPDQLDSSITSSDPSNSTAIDTTTPPPKDPTLKALKLAEKAVAFGAFHLGRAFLESMIVDVFALLAVVIFVFRTEDWPVHFGTFWNAYTAQWFGG